MKVSDIFRSWRGLFTPRLFVAAISLFLTTTSSYFSTTCFEPATIYFRRANLFIVTFFASTKLLYILIFLMLLERATLYFLSFTDLMKLGKRGSLLDSTSIWDTVTFKKVQEVDGNRKRKIKIFLTLFSL